MLIFRYRSRHTLLTLAVTLILLFAATIVSQAQEQPHYNYTDVLKVECHTSTNQVLANYVIDQFFPAGQAVDTFISSFGLQTIVPDTDRDYTGPVGEQLFPLHAVDEPPFLKDTVTFVIIIYAGSTPQSDIVWRSELTLNCIGKADGETGSSEIRNDIKGGGGIDIGIDLFGLDGRLNLEPAAPIVVYQPISLVTERSQLTGEDVVTDVTIFEVYAVDPKTSKGISAVKVSINALLDNALVFDRNVLLASGTNPFTGAKIEVYWLQTSEFQVNTTYADGKTYVFIWDIASGTGYHPEH